MTLQDYVAKFNSHDDEPYRNEIPNAQALDWMERNVPLFSCSDSVIEETYYFRYWTYRKHIKKTDDGHVVTEFLPPVPWSGQYNAIVCPVAHQINEGRWLSDQAFLKEYIRHYLFGDPEATKVFLYQNGFLAAVCDYVLSLGELDFGRELYPALTQQYAFLKKKHATDYGLYWCIDNYDGMEYSISGNGLRPTINSYLCGAAYELWHLAEMLDMHQDAVRFKKEYQELLEGINRVLWDDQDQFYKTVPAEKQSDVPDFARENADRNVMEEIGFIPFAYHAALPGRDVAFRRLWEKKHFAAPFGPTTADQSHPRFCKETADHECLWDGPSWPYATTQTLNAMLALLKAGQNQVVTAERYYDLLHQYASCHYMKKDGEVINWIDENLHPFTGEWWARKILLTAEWVNRNEAIYERGKDYNHSAFCDPVISGLCGITPQTMENGKILLSLQPQLSDTVSYFSLDQLQLLGHKVSVRYDKTGEHFGMGKGLFYAVDGSSYTPYFKAFVLEK